MGDQYDVPHVHALADSLRVSNEALRKIAETARWYAENDARLAHEVDHALCVEILDLAERALDAYPASEPKA